jgi:polyhydroxybutyrate depolymerase
MGYSNRLTQNRPEHRRGWKRNGSGVMQLTGGASRRGDKARGKKRLRFFFAAILTLVSAAQAAATETRRLNVAGEQRSYRLHIPPNLDSAPAPLVIALHGAVQSAAEFETDLGLNAIARQEKFVVAYPEGLNRVWDDARPPIMRLGYVVQPGEDVPFITAMVRRLIAEGIADPNRVYITGLSMGGFMAARMACEHSEMFAAVAMMAATVPEQYRKSCKPRRPFPVLMIHGTFDPIIPFFGVPMGGVGIMSANDTAKFFADLAGCMSASEDKRPSLDRSGTVVVRRWSLCRNNTSVLLYGIPGAGHLPPSAQEGRGDTLVAWLLAERSHAIDAAEEIWNFFDQYRTTRVRQRGIKTQ